MLAFSYGAAARSFLSRGLSVASDAGSRVDCMQPPSRTPIPNSAKTTRLVDISSSLFPAANPDGGCLSPPAQWGQLTEDSAPRPRFPTCPQAASCRLLHERRTRLWPGYAMQLPAWQ